MTASKRLGLTLCLLANIALPAAGQFTAEEAAQREEIERFLREAEIVDSRQLRESEGVTRPRKLTLKEGDTVRHALWKNPEGRVRGFWEGWKYEVAAYRFDKYLELNMVPPTVEKRFRKNPGSCQVWVDGTVSLREMEGKVVPRDKVSHWNRAIYLQRAFDSLIGNDDRHKGNILLTEDWRLILIDHSRSFRSGRRFRKWLAFSADTRDGSKLLRQIPRAFLEKVEALDFDSVKEIVGDYLTRREIDALLARRERLLAEINRLIELNGEDQVLY